MQFDSEARVPNMYALCDNIDLYTVVKDYECYYYLRFQKYPKISKKLESPVNAPIVKRNQDKKLFKSKEIKNPSAGDANENLKVNSSSLFITQVGQNDGHERLWKGLGHFEGYSEEWRSFADIISKEVIDRNLNVKWDDVIGLDTAKQLLKEAVVYPSKYPEMFEGILTPWKGLLLFGPPGTGKTLLAKAVATECNTTFFNISASSLISKWRGESEKLVRVMFELARLQAPSTIFIDEVDSLASKRESPTEHEASRRLKSEFLVQLDGLIQCDKKIFLLTTSNLPWDLDTAILRRLEKHIFVDLPNTEARKKLLKRYLPPIINTKFKLQVNIDYPALASRCEGYSGSDIKLVCKETAMEAMRPLFPVLGDGVELSKRVKNLKPIETSDVLCSFERTKPTVSNLDKFKDWQNKHGSTHHSI
ncbi:katanin p60 ATPase-containing subunit A-like 2 isoform X2 [Cimex lectularius]|nr:katanin p60 ATPase-containing subunit A-like 2 isoform X2 [Cimex lectularius]XP_024081497.1 katanin p60 ATPase-containing subunit A-like 2 isoform X2 [Cimex lectularius]